MIRSGIDIEEVNRFSSMTNIDKFLRRVFTTKEIEYFDKNNSHRFESIAAHYCAKEAVSKFFGTGVRGFSLKDIEVKHDALGKPYVMFKNMKINASLSLSHTKTAACAIVIGDDMENYISEYLKYSEYSHLLPKRADDANKGDCGRVFIVAGSVGLTGAACLAAMGSLRMGSGLVTVGTPKTVQTVVSTKLTEAMTVPLEENNGIISKLAIPKILEFLKKSDVCVFGMGVGKSPDFLEILKAMLSENIPLLIDADGINALSENIDILKNKKCKVVLTPHPGEMSRLTGLEVAEIQQNREKIASDFASEYDVVLLLKGSDTVIASPSGAMHINKTGNSGMASGGMGDVLSGIIGSCIGQNMSVYNSAVFGAFIHGLAGDFAAKEYGKLSMIATDLIENLPHALRFFE
ncbi:MAG: NAD(P)H-hydrate dehydratase [Oscillospiraceae bacterium]